MSKLKMRVMGLLMVIAMMIAMFPLHAAYAATPEEVDELYATVTLPKAGQHPVLTGSSGDSSKYTVEHVIFEDNDNNELSESDTFTDGEKYHVYVHFKAKEGYKLNSSSYCEINGTEAQRWLIYSDDSLLYHIEYVCPESNYITKVIMDFDNSAVSVNPNCTGREITEALRMAIVSVDGGVWIDNNCTSLVQRKTNTDSSVYYDDLGQSDELIETGGIYYYRINLEDKTSMEWDPDNLPEFSIRKVDMSTISYFLEWFSDDRSSVNVYIRAYVTSRDFVYDLDVKPDHQKIRRGSSFQFTAEVKGTVSTVYWQLTEASSGDTYIEGDGLVHVDEDEPSDMIVLTATSTFNSRISDTVYIDITDEDVYISKVEISPKTASQKPGLEVSFDVIVEGTDDHYVTWELFGANHPGTHINPFYTDRGYLVIDKDETATSITVRVTSTKDPSKYDEATVTVIPLDMIHEATITCDYDTLQIDETVTGKQVSQQFFSLLEISEHSENIYFDNNCSYLVLKNKDGVYESLKDSEEKLDPDNEYYLLFNLEDPSGYEFDPAKIPSVKVNDNPADDVTWYSDDCSSVNVYVRVFLEGSEPAELPLTYTNVYGSGIKISWSAVPGATSYKIMKIDGNGAATMLTTVSGTNHTDTDVIGGEKYAYLVSAVDSTNKVLARTTAVKTIVYNPFKDVKTSASYFKYLMWAYNNGVIKGTSSTTFNPDGDCKRCDLAVMLYRMYGKPSVSGMSIPFTDVKSSDYFYKAVVWAYNKGYIKGTSSTTFKPNGSISRQDMVVILWRMVGSPVVEQENPFTDVKPSDYSYKAIMWAYKNKITSGTSATKFSPKSNCLRYQLAVFLNKFNNIVHVIS